MSKYTDDKYIVVDLETTGLDPFSGCEIIEIGIIPSHITGITSITNEMIENEQSLETVLPNFRKYVGDTTIIAHNAKFDLKFLNYYLDLLGLEPINNHICTLEMLKKCKSYKGKNKKLETACKYYNIVNEHAHRANSDTLATAKLFLTIKDDVE